MSAPAFIADFDSASAMLRATASVLHGRDFPGLGMDQPLEPLIPLANVLPDGLREQLYTWSGWSEAVHEKDLADVDIEEASAWAAGAYPARQYPAVAIGSSNGAAVHLCAALGIPWLPQTWLIPVRRHGVHPDEPVDDLAWGLEPGRALLDANPDLQLHHMHDPNQDRLMVRRMTYFRVKRRRLGAAYEAFIRRQLQPAGTIFVVECELRWPVVRVGERHYFQPGATGGAEPEEYVGDSRRVEEYLQRYGSHRRQWQHIEPTEEQPEAEWGFAPALGDDVATFAEANGYAVRRLVFTQPEDLSPFVADLHEWWYKGLGVSERRLLADSFILMDPYWTLRTRSVPWWAKFGTQPSAAKLEAYLDDRARFAEIYLLLFSHGVEGVGLAPIERWRQILERAAQKGEFIGVDEDEFPRDFATLTRYHQDLTARIAARHPLPTPLAIEDLDRFAAESAGRYQVSLGQTPTRVEEGGGDDRIRTGE